MEEETTYEDFDPWAFSDQIPHDTLARMRAHCPVPEIRGGARYLSRYEDAEHGFMDWRRLASRGGVREPGTEDPTEEELIIFERDGSAHLKLRRPMRAGLAFAGAMDVGPHVRCLAESLLDAAVAKGQADLMSELAIPIPGQVILRIVGIDAKDFDIWLEWLNQMLHGPNEKSVLDQPAYSYEGSLNDFVAAVDREIEARRSASNPPRDWISGMLNGQDSTLPPLSPLETRNAVVHMLISAYETTAQLIGNLLYRVIANPDVLQTLRDNRELVGVAVDESLRLDPPAPAMFRTVVERTEFSGEVLDPDVRVTLGIASANRDESVFSDADSFRLDRPNSDRHLSFGRGRHLCIGNDLARLEARTVLETFLEKTCHVELAAGFTYKKTLPFFSSGPQSLDVVIS